MKKEKYVFNEWTLQYEKHKTTKKQRIVKLGAYTLATVFTAFILLVLLHQFFPSPTERALRSELTQLKGHLETVSEAYDNIEKNVNELHNKDNQVHRLIFNAPAIDEGKWEGGTGGVDKFKYLNSYQMTGELIKKSLVKIDKLKHKLDLQENSLDSLYNLALKREKRIASVPSIKPVRSDKLRRDLEYLSGFGIRLHPVHKVRKLHKGIDFTAPQGTAIQATGDGVVVEVDNGKHRGYGNSVLIDHGFGFQTLYAHMHTIKVKTGERLVKGQQIGTVGNTGTSTAPHLHYEVHINGKAVNPIDYVLDGLTPAEYKEIVEKAMQENQSWD